MIQKKGIRSAGAVRPVLSILVVATAVIALCGVSAFPSSGGWVAVMRDPDSAERLRQRLARCAIEPQADGRTMIVSPQTWSLAVSCAVALGMQPGVQALERNRTVHVAGWWASGGATHSSASWYWDHVLLAQARRWSDGQGVTIAVVDTGVDAAHPDLQALTLPGINVADPGGDTGDIRGHGTAVAGVVATAFASQARRAGVGDRARILPVKVSEGRQAVTLGQLARGIYAAADAGARVVNVSYEGLSESPTIRAAAQYLRQRNGVLVVPAGNKGLNPGWRPNPLVVSVGATDERDRRPAWASFGWHVSLAAPGTNMSTAKAGGGHLQVNGSSYAAPMVAGVLALMMAVHPTADVDQLQAWLLQSSRDLGAPGPDEEYGYGRLDAAAAVDAARLGARFPSQEADMPALKRP